MGQLFLPDYSEQLAREIVAMTRRKLEAHDVVVGDSLGPGWPTEVLTLCRAYMDEMERVIRHFHRLAADTEMRRIVPDLCILPFPRPPET